ncbi:MAG: sigma-54-dependent Fis family transcriptional regulator [Acidobacteria bacterium]|nr:sigma-54-dependent Fis family transcriptional regulator [Acidobacteriota bacterium]MCB9397215.1 sigma-54-dependent Fis family transcriptional regulator [Acidobacteriota bacterium]
MALIWMIEDHKKIQAHMSAILREKGFLTRAFDSVEDMEQVASTTVLPDLLLLDIRLPGKSGLDLVRAWGNRLPPTLIISGEATLSEALESVRLGVLDFLEKPFSDERLICSVQNALEKIQLKDRVRQLEGLVQGKTQMIGQSEALERVRAQVAKVAPTQARVLITGESGCGKELVAALIHQSSPRANGPFVRINCAAIPSNLIEDELFGHVRGAFTDARTHKKGLFEEAHQGTLFLDEIGDMDLALQSRLLRVLEDGRVRPLGSNEEKRVDVRVLAATNRDLMKEAQAGKFREDLYYRLCTVPIHLPPLRERREDIPVLIEHFLSLGARTHHLRAKAVDPEVFPALQAYAWPGNIRELKNVCERLVIFGHDPIVVDDLPLEWRGAQPSESGGILRLSALKPMSLKAFKHRCEWEFLETMLRRMNWNYVAVAEALEINRSYLHQKITALGLRRGS